MKKQIESVNLWNTIAGSATEETKQPYEDYRELVISLIEEEVKELRNAAFKNDREEILDALGDTLVVLMGCARYFEMSDKLEEAFDLIMESNFSKFCFTEEEAIKSVENYKMIEIETYFEKVGALERNNLYVIRRSSDKKILKGINYKKVDLKKLSKQKRGR